MYAYQLFEEIKSDAIEAHRKYGNKILYNVANNLFNALLDEGFSEHQAWETVAGGFACVACNDGKVSRDEFNAYATMGNDYNYTYDDFFNVMSKYNKQQHRDNTVNYYNRIRNSSTAHMFVSLCIAVAIVDGNVASAEESFCTSLCEVYLNRFHY